MKESEINNYLEYWMEADKGFSAILEDPNNMVEDLAYDDDLGIPIQSNPIQPSLDHFQYTPVAHSYAKETSQICT